MSAAPFDPLAAGWVACPRCAGTGLEAVNHVRIDRCPRCDGSGMVVGPPADGLRFAKLPPRDGVWFAPFARWFVVESMAKQANAHGRT